MHAKNSSPKNILFINTVSIQLKLNVLVIYAPSFVQILQCIICLGISRRLGIAPCDGIPPAAYITI